MSKANEILKSIRLGFADVKHMFKLIPTIVKGIKTSTKKEILKAHVHDWVDKACDTYGQMAIDYSENVNLDTIQGLVEDVCFLIAKYEEPLKQTAIALSTALNKTMSDFEKESRPQSEAISKILKAIVKENKWEDQKLPSDIQRDKEVAEENLAREKKEHELAQKKDTLRRRHILNLRHLVTESQYELRGDTTKTYETWLREEAVKLTETSFMS